MRVLLVTPHNDLVYARAEASDWEDTTGLTVRKVPSPVTIVAVLRALQEDAYDLVVFIAHGSEAGVELEGGELLDYETLAPSVRGRVPFLFFNTCSSDAIAQAIATSTGAQVGCTIGVMDDRHAYAAGSALAKWLGRGISFPEASYRALTTRGYKLVQHPEVTPAPAGAFF